MFATTHMMFGFFLAYFLQKRYPNVSKRKIYTLGYLSGLIPDLDAVPGLIEGVIKGDVSTYLYKYHHIYTHTLIAMGIVFLLGVILFHSNKPLFMTFVGGYGLHLICDFIDNGIPLFSPWFSEIYGLWLCYILPGFEHEFIYKYYGTPMPFYEIPFTALFICSLVLYLKSLRESAP